MALIGKTIDLRPDAVVSDIYMPGRNGIESAAEIIRQGACQAVVILSMYNEPHLVEQALGAGIRGYVLKEDASAELIPALRAAIEGRKYYSRGLDKSRKIVQPDGNL
jgi:DNA-binding NarL/FixJ family response regulator